jgi:hypothetical protein
LAEIDKIVDIFRRREKPCKINDEIRLRPDSQKILLVNKKDMAYGKDVISVIRLIG